MIEDRRGRKEWPAAPFRAFDPVTNAFDGEIAVARQSIRENIKICPPIDEKRPGSQLPSHVRAHARTHTRQEPGRRTGAWLWGWPMRMRGTTSSVTRWSNLCIEKACMLTSTYVHIDEIPMDMYIHGHVIIYPCIPMHIYWLIFIRYARVC
jgi:hypothetical protein